jgi:hypothetical protein
MVMDIIALIVCIAAAFSSAEDAQVIIVAIFF